MQKIIEDLNWRYATKRFDPALEVEKEKLNIIKESLRLVPTSFGLQPLKYLIITNPAIRKQLQNASFNQSQITEASHLIVICTFIEIRETDIEDYLQEMVETQQTEASKLEGFRNYLKSSLSPLSPEEKKDWNSKQAYIALGQLLHTCAQLRIDATPMEGFEPEKYDSILGLKKRNLQATLVCPIGYRHTEDHTQHRKKVRRKMDDLFEEI